MSETRERVYNVPYETYHAPKKGISISLFQRLKSFNLDRQQVAYDLLDSGERFLDIGCGFGLLVTLAKNKFDEVFGIDFCASDIERGKQSVETRADKDKIHFLNHDLEKGLPFGNSSLDAVSCVAVLEHIFSPPMLLDEICRILKPGGQFIVQVPNYAWFPYRLQLLLGKLPNTGGADKIGIDWLHVHNFTESNLRLFLESKGFKVVRTSASGVFAKYRRWWLSMLSSDIVIKSVRT